MQIKTLPERPKYGQIWKTAHGHLVRIGIAQVADIIETAYVDGPVSGYSGAMFDLDGTAARNDDRLVERVS